jgi:hypothetical protein
VEGRPNWRFINLKGPSCTTQQNVKRRQTLNTQASGIPCRNVTSGEDEACGRERHISGLNATVTWESPLYHRHPMNLKLNVIQCHLQIKLRLCCIRTRHSRSWSRLRKKSVEFPQQWHSYPSLPNQFWINAWEAILKTSTFFHNVTFCTHRWTIAQCCPINLEQHWRPNSQPKENAWSRIF